LFEKKIEAKYLRYILFGLQFGNTVMQSRFARDLQLRVSDIRVSFQQFVLISFHFLLVLFLFNLFSLDYGSAEEACENFA
jgi:uncharacterized membrane protein